MDWRKVPPQFSCFPGLWENWVKPNKPFYAAHLLTTAFPENCSECQQWQRAQGRVRCPRVSQGFSGWREEISQGVPGLGSPRAQPGALRGKFPPEGSGGPNTSIKTPRLFIWARNGGEREKEEQFLQQELEGAQWLFQAQSLSVNTVTLTEHRSSPEVCPRDQSYNK